MIVQAIADFTPGTVSKMLKSLQPTDDAQTAPRERSREKEKEKKHGSENHATRYCFSSFLTPDDKPEQRGPSTKYIYFLKDDLVKVSYDAGNGWWYGNVVETFDQVQNEHMEQGFFASTYVQQLTSLDSADTKQPDGEPDAAKGSPG